MASLPVRNEIIELASNCKLITIEEAKAFLETIINFYDKQHDPRVLAQTIALLQKLSQQDLTPISTVSVQLLVDNSGVFSGASNNHNISTKTVSEGKSDNLTESTKPSFQ